MQKLLQPSLSDQLVQIILQVSTILYGVSLVLVVLAIKSLIAPQGVSCHLIWQFEEWLILDLLQNLVHWFSEHRINHLSISRPRLPRKVSPRSVVIILVRPKILHLLRDNLSLTFPLLLAFFNHVILVNPVHELVYTGDRLSRQRLP